MHRDPHDGDVPFFLGNALRIHTCGQVCLLHFLHGCGKGDQGFDVQLSGIDKLDTQVLNVPLYPDLVTVFQALQMHGLPNGQSTQETLDLTLLAVTDIEEIDHQCACQESVTLGYLDIIYMDLTFFLDHPAYVRLDIRHI